MISKISGSVWRARAILAESRLDNVKALLIQMTDELERTEYNSRDDFEDGANCQLREDILKLEDTVR